MLTTSWIILFLMLSWQCLILNTHLLGSLVTMCGTIAAEFAFLTCSLLKDSTYSNTCGRKNWTNSSNTSQNTILGTSVHITDLALTIILNLISNTMFSIDLIDPRFESAQEFRELMWRIMESVGKPNISDYFPIFRSLDLQGMKRGTIPSYKRLREILDGIIHERMKLRASNSTTSMNDFLDVLLDQCQMDGSDFSSKTIKTSLVVRHSPVLHLLFHM